MSINRARRVVRQQPGGPAVIKGGNPRKILCPQCHQMASPGVHTDGTPILVCPRGHKFRSTKM